MTLYPRDYVWISIKLRKHCRDSQIAWIGEIWQVGDKTILVVRFWENYYHKSGLWKAYPSKHCQTLSVETVDNTCEGRQDDNMFITQNAQGDRIELDGSRARYYKLMRSRSGPKKSGEVDDKHGQVTHADRGMRREARAQGFTLGRR